MAERLIIPERKPEIRLFHPDWWHTHGTKMHLVHDRQNNTEEVIIKNNTAQLNIKHTGEDGLPWNIQWSIVRFIGENTIGNRIMNTETLLSAFGFDNKTSETSAWLIHRFGGTCAEQGEFIRWRRFLNIPHPGTGHDGDPNISVELDTDIQQSILNLLSSKIPSYRDHLSVYSSRLKISTII